MRHLLATLLARRKPTPAPRCDGGALGVSRYTIRVQLCSAKLVERTLLND